MLLRGTVPLRMALLKPKLLAGRRIALAGTVSAPIAEALAALGAELEPLPAGALSGEEQRVGEWAGARSPLHALLYCAAEAEQTDMIWASVREVAVGALIPARGNGKLILLAPRPSAGGAAVGLRAALENLARTLSVEWARYGVTAVMIAPGASTTDRQLAELVSFVVSEAGDYLSGCRFELGALT